LPPTPAEIRPGEAEIYVTVGEAEEARGELGTAARAYREALRHDPGHARARSRFDAICELLRPPAPRPARWTLVAIAQAEIDSNVELLPTDAPPSSMLEDPEADGALSLVTQATYRPRPEIALSLVASARKQMRLSAFDRLSGGAKARARLGAVRLGYEGLVESLGGRLANFRQEGEVGVAAGRFRAAYRLIGRLDQLDETRGFRGLSHVLAAGVLAGTGVYLEGWGERAQTREPLFRHWGLGARVVARRGIGQRVSLGGEARMAWSSFDEIDIDGSGRRDLRLDLAAELEVALGRRFSLLAGVDGVWSWSTIPDFDFSQIVATAGIAFQWEAP